LPKNAPKSMFLGKLSFWGKKNTFYQKIKVVPKTLSYSETGEKINFDKNIFLRGVRGS